MKFKLFSTVTFSVFVLALNAQMEMPSAVTAAGQNAQKTATQTQTSATQTVAKTETSAKGSVGSLISQFSGQLSSGALTDEFNKGKSAFQSQASSATDVKGTSGLLQKLEAGIKSPAFAAGWAKVKDKWLADTKSAKTEGQLATSLKTLVENIDPKSLSATWERVKPTFTAALAKIK